MLIILFLALYGNLILAFIYFTCLDAFNSFKLSKFEKKNEIRRGKFVTDASFFYLYHVVFCLSVVFLPINQQSQSNNPIKVTISANNGNRIISTAHYSVHNIMSHAKCNITSMLFVFCISIIARNVFVRQ